MATVTTHGEAVVQTAPDDAIVRLAVTKLDRHPAAALGDVTERSAALARLLDELAIPEDARTTTGVGVYEELEHTKEGKRRSLGHRASATMSVRVGDAELIGRLIAQATERAGARVSGPRWYVDPANPAHVEAARLAAADARRRAEAYAQGLGARLGAVRSVRDAGGEPVFRRWRAAASAGGEIDDMPIDPGAHEISASVTVTFALEEG